MNFGQHSWKTATWKLFTLSYSEIVRQYKVADPNEVFKLSVQNDKTIQRAVKVVSVFDELQKAGIGYRHSLGIIGKIKNL